MNGNTQPPPQAVANLPIIETVVSAFPATYGHPLLLLRAAGGGLTLLAVAFGLALVWPNGLTAMLFIFAPLVAYVHFGVNWYRIQLLGPEAVVRPGLRWDGRHWRCFAYALLFVLASLLTHLFLAVALPFAGPLISIFVLYFLARFSFIFPALAVEERYSLAYAWRHTRGQGLRLTAALLLAGIPLYLILMIIVAQLFVMVIGISVTDIAALQGAMSGADSAESLEELFASIPPQSVLTVKVIVDALFMAVLAVLFTIVATAFRVCTGWVPAAANLPAAPEDEGPGDSGQGDDDPGSDARF